MEVDVKAVIRLIHKKDCGERNLPYVSRKIQLLCHDMEAKVLSHFWTRKLRKFWLQIYHLTLFIFYLILSLDRLKSGIYVFSFIVNNLMLCKSMRCLYLSLLVFEVFPSITFINMLAASPPPSFEKIHSKRILKNRGLSDLLGSLINGGNGANKLLSCLKLELLWGSIGVRTVLCCLNIC